MPDQGLIAIVPALLWFALALALIALFWRQIAEVLDATSARIRAGAPFGFGWLRVEAPPEVRAGATRVATAEGPRGADEPSASASLVEAGALPPDLTDALHLVHEVQVVAPRTATGRGLYRVRVSLEEDRPGALAAVTRVTYRLHESFAPRRVIATAARDQAFELWLNVYGEFNLVAHVERAPPEASVWLTRYLDLPGRPPD